VRAVDLVLHAGDFVESSALEQLESLGPPVAAVRGNLDDPDLTGRLPAERIVEAEGALIGIVHDAGPGGGRLRRMRRRFPDADAVVFGHSHIPLHEQASGFQIFNPGSPTDRRRQPRHTMGIARAGGGGVAFEHVELD
ncbi:MAG: YfcE family phosphodiesterase, partial [Thermoleophilaceae bacterium]|nr:YfcE family phosphodiesterase [Thermoleophilaceae bacterium]